MNRLVTRLVLSHLVVALLGALTTFLVVRQLAPRLFDESLHGLGMGQGQGLGPSGTRGALRSQLVTAVDTSLLIGGLVGVLLAATFGVWSAVQLIRPLGRVRAATHAMAQGRYAADVPVPRERELADLAEDINHLGATLSATEARRTQLLGDVAHEMRTPLTVLDGTVEAMIDGVLPADAETLTALTDETRRLRRLAEDLSALSRTDESRLVLQPSPIDLSEVACAAAERLRAQAEDAGLELACERRADGIRISGDADRLAQVVTNLVGNAIAATPPGGRVTVTTGVVGSQALVSVTDTGIGLTDEDTERIFERFYRVQGTRRTAGGSGIGLTIARSIVRAHGGELTATSAGPGSGSTFEVRLPR
ncbi:MAG: HAMP domain-containing protein [Actinobacteria bacterium]|jgi:histidine kinase|nr:HAMP domain-containing protein [Actinomycetota bacterium]